MWSFSSYTSTTNRTEAKTDIAAGNTDITNVSVVLTVNGAGQTGQQTETAAGTFSNNLRVYTFAPNPTSLVTSVTLTGPSIPKFQPDPVPQNWMVSPGNGTWTPPSQLSLLNTVQPGKLLGAGSGSVPLATVPLAAIPPRLQGVVSPLPEGGYASPLVGLVGGPTGVGYGSLTPAGSSCKADSCRPMPTCNRGTGSIHCRPTCSKPSANPTRTCSFGC